MRASCATATLILLACLCAQPAAAQQDDAEVLRVTSRVVSVEVLVTDRRTGARVDGLKREDFELSDEGRRQELTHFSQGPERNRPLALALLVDVRGTTKAVVPRLRAALEQALLRLQPEDEVAVLDFWRGAEMTQALTRDRTRVLDALTRAAERQQEPRKKRPDSGKDMAEGLLAALSHLRQQEPQSRLALVVMSDDLNATGREFVDQTTKQLLAGGATVCGLVKVSGKFASTLKILKHGIDAANLSPEPGENLVHYSEQTGGEIVQVRGDDYSAALEVVIGNLVGRYSLGFVPEAKGLDGKFHKLSVKVKVPPALGQSRQLVVRARRGYLAPQKDDAKDVKQKRGKE